MFITNLIGNDQTIDTIIRFIWHQIKFYELVSIVL